MEEATSLEKSVYISLNLQSKPFDLDTERRWKSYEWKINFALLVDETLTAFNKIVCHKNYVISNVF